MSPCFPSGPHGRGTWVMRPHTRSPDPEARRRDRRTLDAVLALDPDRIGPGAACGANALRGLLAWAGRTGRTPTLLSYRTSADATGDRSRVVGYAALALA